MAERWRIVVGSDDAGLTYKNALKADLVADPAGARGWLEKYGQDWALFTDWCAATGKPDLPADPAILRLLIDCPGTRSTHRCRVAAIDHHHTAAGIITPGDSGWCGPLDTSGDHVQDDPDKPDGPGETA